MKLDRCKRDLWIQCNWSNKLKPENRWNLILPIKVATRNGAKKKLNLYIGWCQIRNLWNIIIMIKVHVFLYFHNRGCCSIFKWQEILSKTVNVSTWVGPNIIRTSQIFLLNSDKFLMNFDNFIGHLTGIFWEIYYFSIEDK